MPNLKRILTQSSNDHVTRGKYGKILQGIKIKRRRGKASVDAFSDSSNERKANTCDGLAPRKKGSRGSLQERSITCRGTWAQSITRNKRDGTGPTGGQRGSGI